MRLFIAIPIPGFVLKEIFAIQEVLRAGLGKTVRWTNPASIHLTLKFLGETSDTKKPDIVKCIETACKEIQHFSLNCAGLGVFPGMRQPKVIWVGFDSQPVLIVLQKEIDRNLARFGFEEEKREFSPHLTLGRVNAILRPEEELFLKVKIDEYSKRIVTSFQIEEIHLIKSDLKPSGPIYTVQNIIYLKTTE